MTDFDHFVDGLGRHAEHYTQEQLKLLHVEVRKLADALLATYQARIRSRGHGACPQSDLDDHDHDRTLESVVTERVDETEASRVQDS